MSDQIDVIASRSLVVVDEAGRHVRDVLVHIGRPQQEPAGEWMLPYQIVGLGSGRVFRVHGFDAIQALQGVMSVIGGYLAGTDEAEQGRLRWGEEADLGFPVPDGDS